MPTQRYLMTPTSCKSTIDLGYRAILELYIFVISLPRMMSNDGSRGDCLLRFYVSSMRKLHNTFSMNPFSQS